MKKYIFGFLLLLLITFGIYMFKKPIPIDELKAKYTDDYSNFISINGLKVHYKKKGQGTPILLIHGTSSSLQTWEAWEDQLSQQYTCYSIDMPGGGLTTPPADDNYAIATYREFIDSFVIKLQIDSFYLAGNSLGGHIAWDYAANSNLNDRVKKLILLDPSGFFDPTRPKPLIFQLAQSDLLFNLIEHLNTKAFVIKSLKEVYYNDDLITEKTISQYADLNLRKGNRKAFFLKVRQIETGDKQDLKKIACPTLILWGENDLWIPLKLADIFTANVPNNQLIVYPECGHIPMEELPEESVQDAIHFLEQ